MLYSAWVLSNAGLRTGRKVAAGVAAAFLFVIMAAHSGLHLLDQKMRVAGKVALTRFIASGEFARNPPALYFPYASGWELMFASTYMDFWAQQQHLASRPAAIVERMVLETPLLLVDGHCFSQYHGGRCRHAATPRSGELVVVMPMDDRRLATLDRRSGRLPSTQLAWEYVPSGDGLAEGLARVSLVHRLPVQWNRIFVYQAP